MVCQSKKVFGTAVIEGNSFNNFVLCHCPRDGIPPGVVKLDRRRAGFASTGFDGQFVPANRADARSGNAEQLRALRHFHRVERFAGDDDATLGFAKKQSIET